MKLTKLDQIRAAESRLLLSTYERNPILFVKGEGVHIIDEQGERYLDLLSGIGVNALGYGNTVIEETIAKQSRALIHTSNLFYHEGQAELALRLTERTGLDRCFFSNTGTEAWEGALKAQTSAPNFWRSIRASTAAPSVPCRPPTKPSTASPSVP
jgi:acetylornithine/N-succinyldiaminopimelate aminotransferase